MPSPPPASSKGPRFSGKPEAIGPTRGNPADPGPQHYLGWLAPGRLLLAVDDDSGPNLLVRSVQFLILVAIAAVVVTVVRRVRDARRRRDR